jgi:hypothetical protein
MKPKNNLCYIKKNSLKNSYNFNVYYNDDKKCLIRKSLRIKQKQSPIYNYTRKYNARFYYCEVCNYLSRQSCCKLCKQKLLKEEDFEEDEDIEIITETATISEYSNYDSDDGFVVKDSKEYYCDDCKQYRYSEFHSCVSKYEYIFNK